MISHLSQNRILSIKTTPIQSTIHEGSRTIHLTDTLVVARVRDLTSAIAFYYHDHHVTDCGSWIGIQPAIEEAIALAQTYRLTPESEGEIRVRLTVVEYSVILLPPDRFATLTLPFTLDRQLNQVLESLPEHARREDSHSVYWTTKQFAADNATAVQDLRTRYESDGHFPHAWIKEARQCFAALTTPTTPQD